MSEIEELFPGNKNHKAERWLRCEACNQVKESPYDLVRLRLTASVGKDSEPLGSHNRIRVVESASLLLCAICARQRFDEAEKALSGVKP